MFRTARKLWGAFRRTRRLRAGKEHRDDTALLLRSEKNAERIREALAELDAGGGIRLNMDGRPTRSRAGTAR